MTWHPCQRIWVPSPLWGLPRSYPPPLALQCHFIHCHWTLHCYCNYEIANLPSPLVAPLCLVSLPTINVHWLIVLSGGNCNDHWPISLLITPQFQLAKFPFLDGEFALVHFTLQRSWGSGEQLSCGGCDWSCWNLCDCGDGFKGRYLDCTQPPQPNGEAQTLPHINLLSCVCFIMISGCSYECYWYSVGCGWMVNLAFWYEHKQGESRFLGNRSSFRNLVLLVICSLPDLLLWWLDPIINCSLGNCAANPPLQSRLNVNLDTVSITIITKRGKLKCNIVFKQHFVSLRNAC